MRALLFIVLTYALTWTVILVAQQWGIELGTPPGIGLAAVCMLLPATVALCLQRYFYRESLTAIGLRWREAKLLWLLLAIPMVWVVVLGAFAFIALGGNLLHIPEFGHADFSPESFTQQVRHLIQHYYGLDPELQPLPMSPLLLFFIALIQGSIGGALLNLPFTLGEELGWRGFLLRETMQLGPVRQTLLIGIVWGLWHAPLILQGLNYPGHPWIGIAMMAAFTTSISYPLRFLALAGRSALAPAVFHGVLNQIGITTMLYVADSNPLVGSVPGVAGILSGLILTAAVAIYSAKHPAATVAGERGTTSPMGT
jgi:hypothetical protein